MSNYNTELTYAKLNDKGITVEAGWLTVYSIEPEQREFQRVSFEYLPLGVGLPALSFADKPTLPKAGLALVRSTDGSAWETPPDYRGTVVYNTTTGTQQTVATIGDLPADVTTLSPSTSYDKWNGKKWITDVETQHQAAVKAAKTELAQRQQAVGANIETLEDAINMGMATDAEKATLQELKTYRVLLSRVNIDSAPDIEWPLQP